MLKSASNRREYQKAYDLHNQAYERMSNQWYMCHRLGTHASTIERRLFWHSVADELNVSLGKCTEIWFRIVKAGYNW